MGFDSKRSIEIELGEASNQVKVAFDRWNEHRTVENERLLEEAKEYCHQVAYELQKFKLHEELVENGYEFDSDEEEMVIEYASAWSSDLIEIAEAMKSGSVRRLSFEDYVEQYVVEDYVCRAGKEGVEILREFQRWLPLDDFKQFVIDHYTSDLERVVENFADDYIIILDE